MAKIRNIYLFYTIFFMVIETNVKVSGLETNSRSVGKDKASESSEYYFTCGSSPKSFNSSQFCDGNSDCNDGTDEQDCDKGVILYYYIYAAELDYFRQDNLPYVKSSWVCRYYHEANLERQYRFGRCGSQSKEFLDLVSLDLGTNKEYYVNVLNNSLQYLSNETWISNFSPMKNIWMTTQGLRADIYFTAVNATTNNNGTESYTIRGGRDAFPNRAVPTGNQDSFRNPVMDWSTSYVFAIVDSEIKFCDENITTCFSFIKSKFARDPLLLAISVKQRLLFWTKMISNTQFYLLKYNLSTKNGSTIILKKDLKSPRALTVDAFRDRIHWLEQGDADLVIHSTSFDGSETKITAIYTNYLRKYSCYDYLKITNAVTGPLVKDITSFAVFNNTVYWMDKVNKMFWKCSLNNNCTQMSIRSQIPKKHIITDKNIFELGPLMIDHSLTLANMKTLKKVCDATVCSHMCYPYSETAFDCYCSDGLANKTLCDGRTLIVTYRNLLFTVGLLDLTIPPFIRRYTLSITNISAVAYDSIQDRVILTEVGRQNIYSWTPRTRELKLILAGGPGTISKIEFDDSSNNLYWIDPTNSTLRMMNMKNRLRANLVTGNSSYILSDFALYVPFGQMFLLFVKNNSSTVMERFPMHGGLDSRVTIFEDSEAGDIDHFSVHNNMDSAYENRQLYLLDKQTNELKFITSGGPRTVQMPTGGTWAKIQTITIIGGTLVWTSEDDQVIRRAKIDVNPTARYVYGSDSSSLRRTLVHDATQSILLGDLKIGENGPGILKIASVRRNIYSTMSNRLKQALTRCLQNNGGCEELCVRIDYFRSGSEESTCLCTEGKVVINKTSCVAASEQEATTRPQQPGGISITASTTVERVTETFAISRNRRRDNTSTSFMFLTILGMLAGFALGYFREDLLLKFNSLRSRLSNNYPHVRLSRIRHESTTSLCTRD